MSFITMLPKLPLKVYNAVFTPMGRKSLRNHLKMRRANRNPDFQKDGVMVYSLDNGNQFVLHRDNNLSELVYLEGAYEPLETIIVSKAVQSGDLVLDVGANVGYFTAVLNKLVAPNGQVHSFEPGQGTFSRLQETKKLLKLDQTSLHQKAVSSEVGNIDFWFSTSGSDAQQSTVKVAALGQQVQRHTVVATTLDAFVAESSSKGNANIAFVKCDIEGAELSMIKGAQGLINSQNPPIWMIEHNREALLEHQSGSKDLLTPFVNYDVYFVPLLWPPSIMAAPQAEKWNGIPDSLPDECNLIIFPKKGTFTKRAETLRLAKLIP